MDDTSPIITIDGPSGAGKGTLSKKLATILGWNLLDSGVIYRILALTALKQKINSHDEKTLSILASTIKVTFEHTANGFITFFNNKELKTNIYTEIVGNFASKIAILPKVRAVLCMYQRSFNILPGLVADGRDMGTVIFPNAVLKIFLDASFQERKKRRLNQLQKKYFRLNCEMLSSSIKERDERDYNRRIAPVIPAIDAVILDSTNLSAEEVNAKILIYIRKTLALPVRILYNTHND